MVNRLMAPLRGKLTIGCDVIEAEKLSERLILLLPRTLERHIISTLRLGLREILINAIEHGSLEISFDEKSTESAKADYLAFIIQRQKLPEFSHRTVTVEYDIRDTHVAFRISDQGKGFDHKRLLGSLNRDEKTLDLAHGRGIKMTLRIFDKVRYNSRGNRVTLLKRLDAPAASLAASGEDLSTRATQ